MQPKAFLGFAGPIGAGKTAAAEYVALELFPRETILIGSGDLLRDLLLKHSIAHWEDREVQQNAVAKFEKEYGSGWLYKELEWRFRHAQRPLWIWDGVRTERDVVFFRSFGGTLLYVDTDFHTRYRRHEKKLAIKRGLDPRLDPDKAQRPRVLTEPQYRETISHPSDSYWETIKTLPGVIAINNNGNHSHLAAELKQTLCPLITPLLKEKPPRPSFFSRILTALRPR